MLLGNTNKWLDLAVGRWQINVVDVGSEPGSIEARLNNYIYPAAFSSAPAYSSHISPAPSITVDRA
jgi:hypothetical protein